jgi:hypothetical protein
MKSGKAKMNGRSPSRYVEVVIGRGVESNLGYNSTINANKDKNRVAPADAPIIPKSETEGLKPVDRLNHLAVCTVSQPPAIITGRASRSCPSTAAAA